jgi:hypothetical protein
MKKIILLLKSILLSQIIFAQNVGIGTATPDAKLSVGANSEFQVDSVGNIIKINNVPTNYPTWQGNKNDIMRNDGNGNLSWQKLLPANSIILSDLINPELDSIGFELQAVQEVKDLAYFRGMDEGLWIDSTLTPPTALTPDEVGNATMVTLGSKKFAYYYKSNMYLFDINTGAWTTSSLCTLADFANTRKNVKVVAVGTVIYCIGGYTNLATAPYRKSHSTVAVYNTLSDMWSLSTALPDSISDAGVCEHNGKIYVMYGGKKTWSPGGGYFTINNTKLYERNTTTGGPWVTTNSFTNQLRLNPSITRTNDFFFIIGGQNDNYEYNHWYSERIDVATNSFSYESSSKHCYLQKRN